MKYNVKKELNNFIGFMSRMASDLPACVRKDFFKVPGGENPFNVNLDKDELQRLSSRIGVPLIQLVVHFNLEKENIELIAEERNRGMGQPRLVTVVSNKFEPGLTWEDEHEEAILPALMEVRQILADRVISLTKRALKLYPEDEKEQESSEEDAFSVFKK